MNNKTLNIIFSLIIAAMILWIGLHRYLVTNKNINPWKLGGLAMYTTIHDLDLDIHFFKDGNEIFLQKENLSERSIKAVNRYYLRKGVLGDLESDHKFSKILLEETSINEINIQLKWTKLNTKTNKIETNIDEMSSK